MVNKCAAIILAAGKGSRMNSDLPKVMHRLNDMPLVGYTVKVCQEVQASPVCVVVGHGREIVTDYLKKWPHVTWAVQEQQKGTAHAVDSARAALEGFKGSILIMPGDVPLIRTESLKKLLSTHFYNQHVLTFLSTCMDDPYGYGRCIRNKHGKIAKIVEEKDATDEERKIREINSGFYIVEAVWLWQNLGNISENKHKNEFYVTDLIALAVSQSRSIEALCLEPNWEFSGINTPEQLRQAQNLLNKHSLSK